MCSGGDWTACLSRRQYCQSSVVLRTAGWQRSLSVSYERVSNVLVAQGKLDEALKAYRDGLAIVERLATADPSNMQWRRDLSVAPQR
jgi:hypothetical protein